MINNTQHGHATFRPSHALSTLDEACLSMRTDLLSMHNTVHVAQCARLSSSAISSFSRVSTPRENRKSRRIYWLAKVGQKFDRRSGKAGKMKIPDRTILYWLANNCAKRWPCLSVCLSVCPSRSRIA